MIIELTLPSLSPTMEEGTLVAWHIAPGDQVEEGQVLAEVQTDKAVIEWESLESGHVAALILEPGTHAKVNSVAALFTSKKDEDLGDAVEKAKEKNQALAGAAAKDAPSEKQASQEGSAEKASLAPVAASPSQNTADQASGLRVSPVAARMAAAHGIDLRQIQGSGASGRIIKADIQSAIDTGQARIGSGSGPAPKPKPSLTRPDKANQSSSLSNMRQVIGRRLSQSKREIPHFWVTECVDAQALVELRSQLTSFAGIAVSFNDLVTRACALTLRQHPQINSTFNGEQITQHDSADIAVAVAMPDGLITPIVFAAHSLRVSEIAARVRELSQKAKNGSLQPHEFEGGSFTISNLGMFGIESFHAIINPPQCAILAVGGIRDEAVVRNQSVVAGKTMRLTLSCDHRVVDGADAAAFLRDLRQLLERPAALLW